eukprot:1625550-Pleurochrysis_carterae.AAC.1
MEMLVRGQRLGQISMVVLRHSLLWILKPNIVFARGRGENVSALFPAEITCESDSQKFRRSANMTYSSIRHW